MKNKLLILATASVSLFAQTSYAASDYASFNFAIDAKQELQQGAQAYSVSSNEYWRQVSGAELKSGIVLHTTQPGAVVLLSSAKQGSTELDTGLVQLNALDTQQSAIEKKVSASDLASTGVFANTMAITTSEHLQAGSLQLVSQQSLSDKDSYIVTVKEKHSPYALKLNIAQQSFTSEQTISATAQLHMHNQGVNIRQLNAELIAPDGKKYPVLSSVSQSGSAQFYLSKPEQIQSPINGLYELKVSTLGKDQGLTVQRNAKLAIALVDHNASIQAVTLKDSADKLSAQVEIEANQSSRFEVRAVLYGTTSQGKLIPVMESHAAQTLSAGTEQLALTFDQDMLAKAGVSAPYQLQDIRLYDQQQLGLVDRK